MPMSPSLPRPPSQGPEQPDSCSSRAKFRPKATAAPGQGHEPWAGRDGGLDCEFGLVSSVQQFWVVCKKFWALTLSFGGQPCRLRGQLREEVGGSLGGPRNALVPKHQPGTRGPSNSGGLTCSPLQRNVVRRTSSFDTEAEVESLGRRSWVTSGSGSLGALRTPPPHRG